MKNRRKTSGIWILVSCCAILFCILSFEINDLMVEQNSIINDLSAVEYLSSSSQRLTRMIITGFEDKKVTYYINQQTQKYLSDSSSDKLSVLADPETREIADKVIENWYTLLKLYELSEEIVDEDEVVEQPDYDVDSIVLAADNHFNSMTDLSLKINSYTGHLAENIEKKQQSSYVILGIIAYLILAYLTKNSIAISKNRELTAIASLDVATRLYNRSKCQELFIENAAKGKDTHPAFVVIDLNDLKKTNDTQGHRVGDELITTFANIVKESAYVHDIKPFIGRYGGDEFIVFYEDVTGEEEIKTFMEELATRTEQVNKNENKKFHVSYAIGYAINHYGKDGLGAKQLFDEADENMYNNKKAIKSGLQEVSNSI